MYKTRVITWILIVIQLAGSPMGAQAQGNNNGLVAEWHFDEGDGSVVKDSSMNGNDGTIICATWTTGISGKALRFDGMDTRLKPVKEPGNEIMIGIRCCDFSSWTRLG